MEEKEIKEIDLQSSFSEAVPEPCQKIKKCIRKGENICYADAENITMLRRIPELAQPTIMTHEIASGVDLDEIKSGESLFKTFSFEQSADKAETEKCISFWRTVMEKNLEPIKCTLIESYQAKTQIKKSTKKRKKSKKQQTKAEHVPEDPAKNTWFNIFEEIQKKKLDKIKMMTLARCNMCELEAKQTQDLADDQGIDKQQMEREIVDLNSWTSQPSKPKPKVSKAEPKNEKKPSSLEGQKERSSLVRKVPSDISYTNTSKKSGSRLSAIRKVQSETNGKKKQQIETEISAAEKSAEKLDGSIVESQQNGSTEDQPVTHPPPAAPKRKSTKNLVNIIRDRRTLGAYSDWKKFQIQKLCRSIGIDCICKYDPQVHPFKSPVRRNECTCEHGGDDKMQLIPEESPDGETSEHSSESKRINGEPPVVEVVKAESSIKPIIKVSSRAPSAVEPKVELNVKRISANEGPILEEPSKTTLSTTDSLQQLDDELHKLKSESGYSGKTVSVMGQESVHTNYLGKSVSIKELSMPSSMEQSSATHPSDLYTVSLFKPEDFKKIESPADPTISVQMKTSQKSMNILETFASVSSVRLKPPKPKSSATTTKATCDCGQPDCDCTRHLSNACGCGNKYCTCLKGNNATAEIILSHSTAGLPYQAHYYSVEKQDVGTVTPEVEVVKRDSVADKKIPVKKVKKRHVAGQTGAEVEEVVSQIVQLAPKYCLFCEKIDCGCPAEDK